MTRRLLAFVILSLSLALPATAQPLPTDPALVVGELGNGMRYVVKRHGEPPGRASIRLHVAAGSLHETHRQRGIAHFLEHMAFNGSKNFPPGSVVRFFEELGLTFGQHQNAVTTFTTTTYQLDLPDNTPETLEKGLLFFADIAFRLSLHPEEIEDEREVILEERRSRLSGMQRLMDSMLEGLAPGSLIGERNPIGTEESIRGMTPEDFREFYARWYVPTNMTVVVVADMEPTAVVRSLDTVMDVGDRVAPPPPTDFRVRAPTRRSAMVTSDSEVAFALVSIRRVEPLEPPARTVAEFRRALVEEVGVSCFNRRMMALVEAGEASFQFGGLAVGDLFGAATLVDASAFPQPAKWRDALRQIALELQRARLHGFHADEIEQVRREVLTAAERAIEREASRDARQVAGQILRRVSLGEPMMSATQHRELCERLLPTITAGEVSDHFATLFEPSSVTFSAMLPTSVDVPTQAELLALGEEALAVEPPPLERAERIVALLEEPPAPGEIGELAQHEPTGVWSAWLDNGVRVHYRFMDQHPNSASISVVLAGGRIEESGENRGVTDAAALAWSSPATGTFSSTSLREHMATRKVGVAGRASDLALSLWIAGHPDDLEEGMRLAHLLLTDPRVEQAAFDRFVEQQRQALSAAANDPDMMFSRVCDDASSPDPRVRGLTLDQVDRLTRAQAQEWLDRLIAEAPIEVAVVGDIGRERALELVASYIGSLPPRERIGPSTLRERRSAQPLPLAVDARYRMATPTDRARVLIGFGAPAGDDRDQRRMLDLASRILRVRMIARIREREQLVYGIGTGFDPSTDHPALGRFTASATTAPDKLERLVEVVREMFEEFARTGPSDAELAVARRQIANLIDESRTDPDAWTSTLSDLTYRDGSLDDVAAGAALYDPYSAEDVRAAFARFHDTQPHFRVSLAPVPAPASR